MLHRADSAAQQRAKYAEEVESCLPVSTTFATTTIMDMANR
jgi:hypothetical protein